MKNHLAEAPNIKFLLRIHTSNELEPDIKIFLEMLRYGCVDQKSNFVLCNLFLIWWNMDVIVIILILW